MKPYYEDPLITIYHGDCREIIGMSPDCLNFDSVITDPPYGIGFSGKSAKQRDGSTTTRDDTYTFGDDSPQYIRECVVPIIKRLIDVSNCVVLTPGTACLFEYPTPTDIGAWYSAAGTGRSSWGFRCSQPILFYGKDPYLANGMGARANSFGQTYPNDANGIGHPCAKPIRFVRWLVMRASLDGQMVVDPFMGSGTTLRAAKDLGRKAIGIEIEEKYCEIAAKRMAQEVLPL